MMNIITISREFGSGGRELGKRQQISSYNQYDGVESQRISSDVYKRQNRTLRPSSSENTAAVPR